MPPRPLTNRETEVLKCISQGLISKEIAGKLFISEKTVNTHRQRIIAKLNATNSSEAVHRAFQMGII
ncbi:MAG: response regulator transcription factor [Saprospiraceae bacterium]|nr:response regulator transcription factor [Saprospiraceae bacterium]